MNQFGDQNPSRYETVGVLGSGAYGRVYKGVDNQSGRIIAMKKMPINLERDGIPTTTLREVSLLKELIHPNIVLLYDVVVSNNNFFIIFEFLDRDLRKLMDETQSLTQVQVKKIMTQILSALALCHSRRFMHRDIKPENILIDNNYDIKLADFGLARAYQVPGRPYTQEVQTLWYRAPEVLLGNDQYTVAIDVWSVGCMFAELLRWQPLFHESTPHAQLVQIFKVFGTPSEEDWQGVGSMRCFPSSIERFNGIPMSSIFPQADESALDLLGKLLTLNPNNRITAKEALNHPYLQNN